MVTTLAVLIEEFLLDGRARRLAPKTLSSYASNLGYFLEWLAREGLPDALASFTLANGRRSSRALAHRTARRATFVAAGGPRGVHALVASDEARKPTTAVGSLRALKTFSKWLAAEEQGYAARDVLAGLRLPKCPKTRAEPLTAAEMGRLLGDDDLRAPIGSHAFAIVLTYFGTRLRLRHALPQPLL